jgi:hypothetical protein
MSKKEDNLPSEKKDNTLLIAAALLGGGYLLLNRNKKDDKKDDKEKTAPSAPVLHNVIFDDDPRKQQQQQQIQALAPSLTSKLGVLDTKQNFSEQAKDQLKSTQPLITTAKQLIERIELKDPSVYRQSMNAADAAELPYSEDAKHGRMTIILEDINDLRYFSDLLCCTWLFGTQVGEKANQSKDAQMANIIGHHMMNWFAFHRWCCSLDLARYIADELNRWSCTRIDEFGKRIYRTHTGEIFKEEDKKFGLVKPSAGKKYPAFDFRQYARERLVPYDKNCATAPNAYCSLGQQQSWDKFEKFRTDPETQGNANHPHLRPYCDLQDLNTDNIPMIITELGGDFLGWSDLANLSPQRYNGTTWRGGSIAEEKQISADAIKNFHNLYEKMRPGYANYIANIGPCGAMIEYASVRFLSIQYIGLLLPELGGHAGNAMLDAMSKTITALMAITGAAFAGGPTMIAGAVMAAITAIIAATVAFFQLAARLESTRKKRIQAGAMLDQIWSWGLKYKLKGIYWGNGARNGSAFSIKRMAIQYPSDLRLYNHEKSQWEEFVDPLLDPQWRDHFDETRGDKEHDAYFPLFALVSHKPDYWYAAAIPQMSLFYLGINFPVFVSQAVFCTDVLAVMPTWDSLSGKMSGFAPVWYTVGQLKGVIDKYYKSKL